MQTYLTQEKQELGRHAQQVLRRYAEWSRTPHRKTDGNVVLTAENSGTALGDAAGLADRDRSARLSGKGPGMGMPHYAANGKRDIGLAALPPLIHQWVSQIKGWGHSPTNAE